jgi:hypothetical protein
VAWIDCVTDPDHQLWKVPEPLGYPEAIQAVGGVAAPLLAGFSLSAITLLIGTQPGVRWPGLSLFLFAFATVAFVTAVQTAFHARMHAASPAQMLEWWPGADAERIAALRVEQALDSRRHTWWAGLCRYTYNAGIVAVLLALATVVVPPGGLSAGRVAALIVLLLAVALECLWMTFGRWSGTRFGRWLIPTD